MLHRVTLLMQCTNVLTWELNRYGQWMTDDGRQTTDDRRQTTHFKSFFIGQADRGFARSQLCTNKDGNTNNLVLYTVRNGTSTKGGNALRATD